MTEGRPFPPGDYRLVVVGTGPGGLQLSYDLRRHGVDHALISQDDGPGGMFRRFPMFGRMITCSRSHCLVDRGCDHYFRYDWNSMVTDEPGHQALVAEFIAGNNYFPARVAGPPRQARPGTGRGSRLGQRHVCQRRARHPAGARGRRRRPRRQQLAGARDARGPGG